MILQRAFDQNLPIDTGAGFRKAQTKMLPTRADSCLLLNHAQYQELVTKTHAAFKEMQAALDRKKTELHAGERKIDLLDPLSCYWFAHISRDGKLSLEKRPMRSIHKAASNQVCVKDEVPFPYLISELVISMPRLGPIIGWVSKVSGANLSHLKSGLPNYPQQFNVDPFSAPSSYNWLDIDKGLSRDLVTNNRPKEGSAKGSIRVPKYLYGNEVVALTGENLFKQLGNTIYVKPKVGYSGHGQFVLERQHAGNTKLTASGKETVKALNEILSGILGDASEKSANLVPAQLQKVLASSYVGDCILESCVPALRIEGRVHELRLIVAPNYSATNFKLIATCARKSGTDSLWNNVSKGATPMTFTDAIAEIIEFTEPSAAKELNGRVSQHALELCRSVETIAADVYSSLEIFNHSENRFNVPLCIDLVPAWSPNAGLQYYVMEVQVPYDGIVLGIEQFDIAGKLRRLNYDPSNIVFGKDDTI